VGFSSGDSTKV